MIMPGMGGAPGANPLDPQSIALQAMLGSVQGTPPETVRPPQTPLAPQGKALNPELTRMVMQALMGTTAQAPQQSLGALLGGR